MLRPAVRSSTNAQMDMFTIQLIMVANAKPPQPIATQSIVRQVQIAMSFIRVTGRITHFVG